MTPSLCPEVLSMLTRLCLSFALLAAFPAWSQVDSSTQMAPDASSDNQMLIPPPISGVAYPSEVGSETRSNYIGGGLIFSSGYINNLYPGSNSKPVNDVTYLVQPTISLDQTMSRFHEKLSYSPAFSFYQPTSVLNTTNQNAAANYQFDLSPHVALQALDTFNKTSTAFSQNSFSAGNTISGSPTPTTPGIVAPDAPEWTNNANVGLSWQISRSDMIAGAGTLSELNFQGASEAEGFYDSSARGGSASLTHRLGDQQYAGALYQYSRILATPVDATHELQGSTTQINSMFGYYTIYPERTLSFSFVGGSEYYEISVLPATTIQAWAPAGMASVGWQGMHTSFAGSFSRMVTAGEGVAGAFNSDSAIASARWQIARTWMVGINGNYSILNDVTKLDLAASTLGGHTIGGAASVEHSIGDAFRIAFQYQRLHQDYRGIAAISADPDTDIALVSLNYHLSRPVGR